MTMLTLHPPFVITPRLAVGLQFDGGACLSLMSTAIAKEGETALGRRHVATMVLDLPDGTEYVDDRMQSGCGGFGGVVAVFETFLSFLLAAVESYEFEQRYPGREGENTELFPRHIVEWASENKDDIEGYQMGMYVDPDSGSDMPNEALIEVAA